MAAATHTPHCPTAADTLVANPIDLAGGGIDPGLWAETIFVVNNSNAVFYYSSGCNELLETKDTRSASAYQRNLAQAASISGSYMGTSYSANGDYQSSNSGQDADRAYSFHAGTVSRAAPQVLP